MSSVISLREGIDIQPADRDIQGMKKYLACLICLICITFALPLAAQGAEGLPLLPTIGLLPPPIPPAQPRPMIAIVIDDMGVDVKRSARALQNLHVPVTLSYLPYARHVQQQADAAKARGHEVFLHLPWQADDAAANPGPQHLSLKMTPEKLQENIIFNLDRFTGYSGVNNHMGSKFSRHRPGLTLVMTEIKKRGLFYLDSKTTPHSLAEKVALENGIPTSHRDVFLDHDEDSQMINTSLHEVEEIARRTGSVIAIGHPKDITLAALESWLPTLEPKGFQLVPVSVVIKHRNTKHCTDPTHHQPTEK